MDSLNLQPNEVVILSESRVGVGNSDRTFLNDVYLTNHNIIVVNKSLLGKTKSVKKYPINSIKKYQNNAQVQALEDVSVNGYYPFLQVYLLNDVLTFKSVKWNFDVLDNWVTAINALIDGDETKLRNLNTNIESSQWDGFFNAFVDVKNSFNRSFKKNYNNENSSNKVKCQSSKCVGCSAPIAGKMGETIVCVYCGTEQVI